MNNRYDIERLPTSSTGKRMLKRVSPIYHDAYVAKWLYEVMGLEWDEVWKYVRDLRDQIYPSRVTWGIEYQEYKYSIMPDSTLTLEERRERLHRHITKKGPLNPGVLEKYILDGYGLKTDIDESQSGILLIKFYELTTPDPYALYKYLYNIKPSHLSIVMRHLFEGDDVFYVGGVVGHQYNETLVEASLDVQINIADNQLYTGGILAHQYNVTTVGVAVPTV